jgi:hypothetical protein
MLDKAERLFATRQWQVVWIAVALIAGFAAAGESWVVHLILGVPLLALVLFVGFVQVRSRRRGT